MLPVSGRVRFVFRHFPLNTVHPYTQNAAEVAAVQGQFWQMHYCLFHHQATLDNGSLVECANEVELDEVAARPKITFVKPQ